MARSALITGGTGGLGAAVTRRSSTAAGASSCRSSTSAERERLPAHERLVLEPADLSDADSTAAVTALAAGDDEAPLRAVVNLVGGFADGRPRARDAGRGLRGAAAAEPAPDVPRLPRRDRRTCWPPAAARSSASPRARRSSRSPARRATSSPRPPCWRSSTCSHAEYRDDGIRANAILPSVIDTPANRRSMPDADHEPLGRAGADRRRRALSLRGRIGRRQRRARAGLRPGVTAQRRGAEPA